jgi:bifunctional ADP-heptose synthase (sugar kinase/adenylyltransferase)
MLTAALIEHILFRLPRLTIGVLGDLFCDRYLDIDATLDEPSVETGLTAYQVTRVRSVPGAAGTVVNNLAALGIGRIRLISVLGDDGEGHGLRQALARLSPVDTQHVAVSGTLRTPTYTKPMRCQSGEPPRELNRLDIKNRVPLDAGVTAAMLRGLEEAWPSLDALIVLDQVSEAECGVVAATVRGRLAELGQDQPGKLILADSRERIGLFRHAALKPNLAECRRASAEDVLVIAYAVLALAQRAGRPVFCTRGETGILLAEGSRLTEVPGYPVAGPVDPVGAGDSTSAGIASAVAAGATFPQAAAFGNLVASITVRQIGTTGTATPAQVRQRWQEVTGK